MAHPIAFSLRALYAVLILVGGGAVLGLELCLPACQNNSTRGRQCATIQVIVDEGMVVCGLRHAWKVGGWLNIQQYYVDRDSGRTLLHYAAAGNWQALTRVLVILGANRNARTVMEATPLHYAWGDPSQGVVAVLLTHGANPNARNFLGETPLHQTGYFNGVAVAETLLAHGADPNARDRDGGTPLHIAAGAGASVDVVRVLLAHGVDPQARDDWGQTALDLARHWQRAAAIKILQPYGD